jgi:mannose-6-phosphate isomerase class I
MTDKSKDPLIAPIPPGLKKYSRGLYNSFPMFNVDKGQISSGYPKLVKSIQDRLSSGLRVLVIDGYQGIDWATFQTELDRELNTADIRARWVDFSQCLAGEEEIYNRIEPFLGGDDRIFGTHYPFGPEVFFGVAQIARMRIQASILRGASAGQLTIFYGTGASLIEIWDQLWYLDIPKDVIQENARNGKTFNIGMSAGPGFEPFYKRSYFVDWPALNRQKQRLLPNIDLLIDFQDAENPVMISGDDFRLNLSELAQSAFRVRPWFYPGPWGGKYIQNHICIHPEAPNIAWSFEIIVPENGIVLDDADHQLEFSFDFLMYQENKRVLGKQAAAQFLYEWPIRLDYLDTIDGGNLSTQVHPRPNFIRENFGETYTQDESYYILNAKPGARVYLGLTDDCDPDEFRQKLEHSVENGTPVNMDKYVNSEPSKPHDLFLIPNGTVHGSGRDNLVLEISATPYIFTFKIYDWLRKDLEGKFRPLNIERAWQNIRFERRRKWVKENLIAQPRLLAEGNGWKKYLLADQPENWWTVHRIEFEDEFSMVTNDIAYAANLVEGERVVVISANSREYPLAYAESMIIPAAAERFTVKNRGARPCKLLLVFVRPGIGKEVPLNNPGD